MPQGRHPLRMDGEVAGRQPELEAGGVQDPLGQWERWGGEWHQHLCVV